MHCDRFLKEKLSPPMISSITFAPIDNIIAYLFIAAVFEALAIYLYQFRRTPGALLLVYCQVCKGVWVAAEAFCTLGPDLPAKLFWVRFTDWAPLLLIYFWFEFIWEVSQQKGRLATVALYAVRGLTAAFVLIIAFDGWLGWYYGPVSLAGQVLTIGYGPAVWPMMAFCYALNVVCLAVSVRWVYMARGLRRRQALALAITPVFNFLGTLLGYTIELPALQAVSPQKAGQLLSAFYVTWVFYRWRVYSILPLAQDAVTRRMDDGLMVVDEKGYIVDMNPAAKAIFAGLPAAVGDRFAQVAAAWPVMDEVGAVPEGVEASRVLGGESRFYLISTIPLETPQGNPLGRTMVFKDITQQKRDQQKLLENEKALAILTERDRLGRELHDGQGQIWNYLGLELQSVRAQIDGGRAEAAAAQLERLLGVVREQNADTRESIVGLKKTAAASDDFVTNLENYLKWYEKNNGIAVSFSLPATPITGLLGQAGEVQLLRIILEALTNVRKHAEAREAKVIVEKTDKEVTVTVEDDGRGFDMAVGPGERKSFGLQIMAERAEEAGGRLEIESRPGGGTRVMVHFPLDAKESMVDSI